MVIWNSSKVKDEHLEPYMEYIMSLQKHHETQHVSSHVRWNEIGMIMYRLKMIRECKSG